MENHISAQEAATLIQVSDRTIQNWCRKGLLKSQKDGKSYLIDKDSAMYQIRHRIIAETAQKLEQRLRKEEKIDKCPPSCPGLADYDCLAPDKPCLDVEERPSCPKCDDDAWKSGTYKDGAQRWMCKSCRAVFRG